MTMPRILQTRPRTFSRFLGIKSTSESAAGTIAGTVAPHNAYLFLRAPTSPQEFPSKLTSPLYNALLLKLAPFSCPVNWVWYDSNHTGGIDADAILFYRGGGQSPIPKLTEENLDDVAAHVKECLSSENQASSKQDVHLLVCTHAARDCRCGDTGGAFVSALRDEIARRRGEKGIERLRVGETGHVGGHKHAANLLIYPHGEWLGRLQPSDAPSILDKILTMTSKPFALDDPPLSDHHWRGRMGISKDEQKQLHSLAFPAS